MSKKGLKTMLVCIVLLIGLVTLFACNKSNVADKDGQTKVIVKIQDEDGSIYKENVVFSDLFTLSLQKEGYTGRLYRDADFLKPLTKDSKVKNGDTVYVKWTINKYTVTFMDGEKVLKAYTNVPHGDTVTAPEVPEKDGKTFKEWDKDFSKVTSDLTINAVYDVDTFTVTFKDGEKVLETQTVEYEAAATAPDTARLSPPEGMHFAEWDKDFSKVTEDIEVSAVYELNEYTVTFKNGETMIKNERVKHGFAATAPNVFDTPTEKFVGWDKPFDNVTSDLIVNAKFETKKFTLTFINFDGTTVYTAEVEYGASIDSHFETAVNAVEYDDILDYDGWYKADGTRIDELDLPTMPAENLTLTLKLRLLDSAIGDFKVNTPADFTFTESNSAKFTVTPNEGTTLHAGVTYKYIWTINKDNVFYKTEETTESSLTLQNLAAGEYFAKVRIVASVENCGSVEKVFSADKTLIVSRADISDITVTGVTMTYGDKTAKIGISELREGDVVTYGTDGTTFPLQNVDLSALDCGEYDYFVRVNRGDNYNPYTSGKITVTINKATVSATVMPKSDKLTYGDNLPSLTAAINGETYTIESGKYELHFGYTKITGNVANNVGTYNIENVDISVLRAKYPEKNYNIALTTVGTITINKANLTVTVTSDKTELTYGDELPKITYTFSELKLSDKEDDFTITKTELAEKLDAGTYTASVTISGVKTNFYNITVNTVEFKVNKKAATITINEIKAIVYGDKVPDMKATVDGVLDGDNLSYKPETDYSVGKKPGNYYNVKVVFDQNAEANKNYAITATGTTFYVGTKKLTIKLNNTPTVAVGKTYKVEAEHLDKIGLVAGDTVTGNVTITKDVAGTYYADDFDKSNLVVTNADCYVISYEMSVTFVEVTFAIDFADVTLTYDGQPHSVKVTKTDATKNYTITYGTTENDCTLTSSPEYTNAGADAYKIYFKVVDNDTLADYVGYVTLTIKKKAVTVKVKDVTITYGETPTFSYTDTGLIDPDKLSGKAVYSGAGTDAGDYVISVSGLTASDNYNASFVPGTLTINKKTAEVTWTIAESYVYDDGQPSPTATYDGKTASLIFTKDGKECEFKNAGTYTVTVADDNNYTLSGETTKTIVINKAKYMSVTAHTALSGTYDPNKTLGNYALAEGFAWVDAGETPVCTKTEYAAKYNMDPTNYEDFETKVTLVLQKATVTLAQNLFEFNYDGASHEIGTTVKYNNIEVTEPYTLTFEKNMFSAAGTHKTTATLAADNFALSDNVVYVKVKGVKVGNNYYTIEEALFKSESGDTIEFINGVKEVSFAPSDVAEAIYADDAYRTVKAGVTLKLASDEDSSAKIGKPTYGNGVGNYVDTDSSKIKYKLILNESTVLEVYGNILIQGLLGVNGPGLSGHTSGNHSQIINNGTINLNSGANLDLRGYIKGAGTIEARSGAIVYSPFVVYDYRGGTNTATVYKKGEIAPFRIYEMPNIQCKYSIVYGAKSMGYLDLYASKQHRTDTATIIGNSKAMLIMEDSSSHIIKTYSKIDNGIGMTSLTITGKAKMGTLKISIRILLSEVSVSMTDVRFPMPWNYTINVGDGIKQTTFTVGDNYKMMTGATVNVKKNGTINLTGTVLIYKTYVDNAIFNPKYPNKGAAKLNVEGVVNVTGGIAGEIFGTSGGKVIIGNNAELSLTEKEGDSGDTSQGDAIIGRGTFYERATISEVATFVNADNSTFAAATNKTYNYNNGTWQ